MSNCEVCGNDYDSLFEIKLSNDKSSHWFDCFECAVHKLAPHCAQCGVRILGHGVQADNKLFCCAHCARLQGFRNIVDHTTTDEVVFL